MVNASPLILLAKVGQIDLLCNLTEQLVIPASVVQEIEQGPTHDPARQWLVSACDENITCDEGGLRPSFKPWARCIRHNDYLPTHLTLDGLFT